MTPMPHAVPSLHAPVGQNEGDRLPGTDDGMAPLVVKSLLSDLATLAPSLVEEVRRGSWLDAYLVSAAMGQIAEDHLHPEVYPLDRAADYFAAHGSAAATIAGRSLAAITDAGRAMAHRRPTAARVHRWQRQLAGLVDALADASSGRLPAAARHGDLLRTSSELLRGLDQLPQSLRRAVNRLPACFASFDQQPGDVARLAGQFRDRWPERSTPLLPVGVRTSGSYLAPLCAASLRADGYEDVRVLTIRPGRALLRHELELVRSVARRGGLALVTDDPPVTGSSIAETARQLERAGFTSAAILLLLPVFGAEARLPLALSAYEAVVLPSERWTVTEKITPAAVKAALSMLLRPRTTVLGVESVPLKSRGRARGHVRALFRVDLHDSATDARGQKRVLVEGVGLGHLGRHALAAASSLERFSAPVLGLRDGLLYREWLPDSSRVGSVDKRDERSVATAIAAYVSERHRALPVAEDVSLRLTGESPAWEVASTTLSATFGRAWPLAKVLLTDLAAKRLLRVRRPSVVDGNTDLGQWFFRDASRRSLVKVNVGEDMFSNLGPACFDAAFDLAGATARAGTSSFVRQLRRAYAELGNEPVDEERWLLYELAHLWSRERTQPEEEAELRRARSRALQRYFADVYFADLDGSAPGPLCALDVDGVLETEHLGFPALTPAAALALRALLLHGYRPVLATGRSLEEVTERCRAYGLAGGVAEYGAVSFESGTGAVRSLLPEAAADALESIRSALRAADGVHVDPDYRFAVRAYTLEHGRRVGLDPETIAAVLAPVGAGEIRPIEGEGQTDFMVAGVDKGTGLRALVAQLDTFRRPAGEPPLALAVGDTTSDVPLAGLAARACAPAHAHGALSRAGFESMTMPYQAGLAQAVGELLGHPPGTCDLCRAPRATRERRIALRALGIQEQGRRGMALNALKLAWEIR